MAGCHAHVPLGAAHGEARIEYRLGGPETAVEVRREYAHAVKLWVLLRLGDG